MELDGADGIDLERNRIPARLECNRRHHRAGDDNLPAAQALTERGEDIRDVAYDVDPLSGVGLRIASACELTSASDDAANQPIRCAAGPRWPRSGEQHVALLDVAA